MPNPQAVLYATHASKPKRLNTDHLQKIWIISEDESRHNLEVATQLNIQDSDSNPSCSLSSNDRMLTYKRINSLFFTDTLFGKMSARGYICMQLFVSYKRFFKFYCMKNKAQLTQALKLFTKEVFVLNAFLLEPWGKHMLAIFHAFCYNIGTTLRIIEERTRHVDRAELCIWLLKEAVRTDLRETHAPMKLWFYCAERRAAIYNLTANIMLQLKGQPLSVEGKAIRC